MDRAQFESHWALPFLKSEPKNGTAWGQNEFKDLYLEKLRIDVLSNRREAIP